MKSRTKNYTTVVAMVKVTLIPISAFKYTPPHAPLRLNHHKIVKDNIHTWLGKSPSQ